MTAILRAESRRLSRSSLLLTGVFVLVTGFFLAIFPAMRDDVEAVEEAYPDYVFDILGLEEMHVIEGFAAGFVYPFVVILFGGLYVAYLGGGLIADDVEDRTMDLVLSTPVSRESVLVQKVAALWVPLVATNVGIALALFGGAIAVGEWFDPVGLVAVHVLAVPYLLVCAGIGVVVSVVLDRAGRARVAALGLVFVLWLVESIARMDPDYEWLADLTPSGYYDPTDILVAEEYAFLEASVLLAVFLVLVGVATVAFTRRDI